MTQTIRIEINRKVEGAKWESTHVHFGRNIVNVIFVDYLEEMQVINSNGNWFNYHLPNGEYQRAKRDLGNVNLLKLKSTWVGRGRVEDGIDII